MCPSCFAERSQQNVCVDALSANRKLDTVLSLLNKQEAPSRQVPGDRQILSY